MTDAEHLARSVLAANSPAGFALWKPWALDLADALIAAEAERDALGRQLDAVTAAGIAYRDANAALDSLVAERDRLDAAFRLEVRMCDQRANALVAAEARITELERALRQIAAPKDHKHGDAHPSAIARAALATPTKEGT